MELVPMSLLVWHEKAYYRNYYNVTFNISTLTEQTCSPLNRRGLLCSECYEGYGPAVYAFGNECVKCHGSVYGRWALYLFVANYCILYHCCRLQCQYSGTSFHCFCAILSNLCYYRSYLCANMEQIHFQVSQSNDFAVGTHPIWDMELAVH